MIKMHYAKGIDLSQGIEEFIINSNKELESFVKSICKNDEGETVYLYTDDCDYVDDSDNHHMTIIVTAKPFDMLNRVKSFDMYESEAIIHIQEYESFESAYAVALDMREIGKLCYDNK
jgi:hypothetical protein